MMDRADKAGFGVAVVGHLVVFGLLSLSFLSPPAPKPKQQPIDVSLVDDVAIEAAAPEPAEEPAQSQAPEAGPPEDAPPPAPEEVAEPEPAPEPVPPAPQPKAAPPPRPVPKPAPKPPEKKVAPVTKPEPVKTPPKPAAKAPSKKPAPAKPAPVAAKPSTAKSTGKNPDAAAKPKPRGSRLGDDFLQGLSADPSKSTSQKPVAAKMSASAAASIGSAIKRQVQPCADRQVNPGPGASEIVVTLRLRINRDGSLAGRPTIAGAPRGVTDGNERYVDAVNRNAINAFVGCAPLRGLPQELYDVPGGWNDFRMTYKLPG